MNKLFCTIFAAFILITPFKTYAAEEGGTLNLKLKRKNPFAPQLPEKVVIEPVKPVVQPQQRLRKPIESIRRKPTPKTDTLIKPADVIENIPQKVTPPNITITGIVWNSERPQAIINNEVMDIGDKVDTFTITDIRKGEIDMKHLNQTVTVHP